MTNSQTRNASCTFQIVLIHNSLSSWGNPGLLPLMAGLFFFKKLKTEQTVCLLVTQTSHKGHLVYSLPNPSDLTTFQTISWLFKNKANKQTTSMTTPTLPSIIYCSSPFPLPALDFSFGLHGIYKIFLLLTFYYKSFQE